MRPPSAAPGPEERARQRAAHPTGPTRQEPDGAPCDQRVTTAPGRPPYHGAVRVHLARRPVQTLVRSALAGLTVLALAWPASEPLSQADPAPGRDAPAAAVSSVMDQAVPDDVSLTGGQGGSVAGYVVAGDGALGTDDSVTYVYTPPGYDPTGATRYPVVYLFHGVPGSSSDWFDGVNLADELDTLISSGRIPPVIAVSPEISTAAVDDTECLDSTTGGPRIDTYLTQVVVPWVDATFPTAADRAHRTLLGFSMGAFCATNMLFQHQDLFTAAGAMAAYADPGEDAAWLLATEDEYETQSPGTYLADPSFSVGGDLTLYLTVGTLSGDLDVEDTAYLAGLAANRGVSVVYEPDDERDHTWDMVDANLEHALVYLLNR